MMIPIDSPAWSGFSHAYGSAEGIPTLLMQLRNFPSHEEPEAEPYFSLWSALCHQGDAYSASYAAVPHIVAAIGLDPTRAPWTLFLLVASIEISRRTGHGPEIDGDLRAPYEAALKSIPGLVASASAAPWDQWYCGAALACVAVAKGHIDLGRAILELDSDSLMDFLAQEKHH